MNTYDILNDKQFGFWSTNLAIIIELEDEINTAVGKKEKTTLRICLDLSKAFMIKAYFYTNKSTTIYKQEHYKFRGIEWFKNY